MKFEVFTSKGGRGPKGKAMTTSQRVARRTARLRKANRCITCARAARPSGRSVTGFSKFCEKHLAKARETKRAELARKGLAQRTKEQQ